MPRTKSTKRLDRLVASAGRGEAYQREADSMKPTNPAEHATQKWMSGMAEHFRRQFASRLREERENAGMTQYALAKNADVDPAVVQRIESGERSCTFQTAVQLAGALGVQLGILAPEPAMPDSDGRL